jgi:hypothetical protein
MSNRPVGHALDNVQKCSYTDLGIRPNGGNEKERGTGSEEAELQATLYKDTINKLWSFNGKYMCHLL